MMSKNNQREHQKFGLLTNIQLYKTSRNIYENKKM